MTGRIGVMGTAEQWYHAGRDHVFFAVEADIHHGDLSALALPALPPGCANASPETASSNSSAPSCCPRSSSPPQPPAKAVREAPANPRGRTRHESRSTGSRDGNH